MSATAPVILPAPAGPVIATLQVAPPPGTAGQAILAALKRDGRVRAWGRAVAPAEGTATVELRTVAAKDAGADGWYQLWVTVNLDGRESCYPGFGEWFITDPWDVYDATRLRRVGTAAGWRQRALSAPENRLRIHYHRYDGAYDNVGIWTWDGYYARSPEANELQPVAVDDFGLVFELDRAEYGLPGANDQIGLVPRMAGDWTRKDGEDKYWRPEHGHEIYLIGTRAPLWSERPDLAPHLAAAWIEAPTRLIAQVSQLIGAAELAAAEFTVVDDEEHARAVVQANLLLAAGAERTNYLELFVYDPLDVEHRVYRVRGRGYAGEAPAIPRGVLDYDELFFDPNAEMGATYAREQTTFRLFAPTAHRVEVVLYDNAVDAAGRVARPMARAGKGIWQATVPGDLAGRCYLYRLEGPEFPQPRELVDVAAVNTVNSSYRARITDLAATNPPAWETGWDGPSLASPVDMIIYELHVRDFTIAANSGVKQRGLYRGFAESGTTLPADAAVRTGLDHLVELGVTHVQLMPVQDFENDEARPRYDWGYMPIAFNSPEGWYATNIHDDSRVRELKQLVQALHARGLGVILDVVYNHTSGVAPFNSVAPHYYYRILPDGSYANGSGCGNEFRTESAMGRKYIIDSLCYWVEEYGIDGFRFDLMALIDRETMREVERELRALKPQIVLYGEPWSAGPSPLAGQPTDKFALRGTRLGGFNDGFRNALKGAPNGDEPGFIQDGRHRDGVKHGIEGSIHSWAASPAQSINYLTCHDNLVLYDKLKASQPAATDEQLIAMMKLGYLALFTAQGVPFLHGGEDFARSKGGHHNSYNAPDEVNQIDWSLKRQRHDLFAYVRDLIALRKAHPLFRLRDRKAVIAALRFHPTADERTLLFTIERRALAHESWRRACVILNAADEPGVDFGLPAGPWHVALDHQGALVGERIVEHSVRVRPKSGLILYQPAA